MKRTEILFLSGLLLASSAGAAAFHPAKCTQNNFGQGATVIEMTPENERLHLKLDGRLFTAGEGSLTKRLEQLFRLEDPYLVKEIRLSFPFAACAQHATDHWMIHCQSDLHPLPSGATVPLSIVDGYGKTLGPVETVVGFKIERRNTENAMFGVQSTQLVDLVLYEKAPGGGLYTKGEQKLEFNDFNGVYWCENSR